MFSKVFSIFQDIYHFVDVLVVVAKVCSKSYRTETFPPIPHFLPWKHYFWFLYFLQTHYPKFETNYSIFLLVTRANSPSHSLLFPSGTGWFQWDHCCSSFQKAFICTKIASTFLAKKPLLFMLHKWNNTVCSQLRTEFVRYEMRWIARWVSYKMVCLTKALDQVKTCSWDKYKKSIAIVEHPSCPKCSTYIHNHNFLKQTRQDSRT